LNLVILHGRLARDPDCRTTPGGKRYCRFPVAVDRPPTKDGERKADFPGVVAWERTADFVEKYFHKGKEIIVTGRLQTGSYEKDGTKFYTTDVIADRIEFCGSGGVQKNDDVSAPDGATVTDDDIPF